MSDSRADLQAVRQLAQAALARARRRERQRDEDDAAFAAQLTRRAPELELLEAAE